VGRAVLRRIREWRSGSPKLARLPDDVATILEFVNSYRRLPARAMSGIAEQARSS
jgi:hypothetical protein